MTYPAPLGSQGYAQPASYPSPSGPIGKVRGTGASILFFVITLGIYGLVWTFKVHSEMKNHRGVGLGGGLALVIDIIVSPVMGFLTPSEVGALYEARGQQKPVGGATGLWYFPGAIILVGPIVWFVKTNGALNDYWRSVGAS